MLLGELHHHVHDEDHSKSVHTGKFHDGDNTDEDYDDPVNNDDHPDKIMMVILIRQRLENEIGHLGSQGSGSPRPGQGGQVCLMMMVMMMMMMMIICI